MVAKCVNFQLYADRVSLESPITKVEWTLLQHSLSSDNFPDRMKVLFQPSNSFLSSPDSIFPDLSRNVAILTSLSLSSAIDHLNQLQDYCFQMAVGIFWIFEVMKKSKSKAKAILFQLNNAFVTKFCESFWIVMCEDEFMKTKSEHELKSKFIKENKLILQRNGLQFCEKIFA